ncbi:MAG: dicarboxylate/amino acid:cation symporter [Proteobacteria bacterium]|nr:dicarboxylate/amino acid:cation symporter [Pseudomonadota bacterium]
MFRKMPFILVALILLICFLGNTLPLEAKAFLYSISLSIKSIIITLLPFIIFGLLFKVMATLTRQASKLIFLILAGVCCSNFISTFLSHYVGVWVYHFDLSVIVPENNTALEALWTFSLPKVIPNNIAMFSGLALGFIASYFKPSLSKEIAAKMDTVINHTLRIFTYFIPMFVAGFVIKLEHEGVMLMLIKDYALIFTMIALAQFSYISFIYFIAHTKNCSLLQSIKNMLPAAITGFSTMSSAAAMPLTILGSQKNANHPDIAPSVIPATVNVHLIGDCFAIPILAYAILKSFDVPEPTLINYLIFAFYFVLAKFSVAAVPGGGIMVMLPVLETYLGFNSQMLSLITAMYILFDPVITSANVLGNGGFALIIDKIQGRLFSPKVNTSLPCAEPE